MPEDDPRLLGLRRLLWVMDRLRAPDGCPWDLKQTHASLRGYLLEETYELLDALDQEDPAALLEELGDVLFQVVFHARIAQDEGRGSLGEVAQGIADKLLRRHPHVFDPDHPETDALGVQRAWQEHKRREGRRSVLDGLPGALPALLRAQRLQEKAAAVGFDWPDAQGPRQKLHEELGELERELEAAGQGAPGQGGAGGPRVASELGDLLFSAVNLARHLGLDAEACLREAAARFEGRFRRVEAGGGDLRALSLEELDRRWEAAKAEEPPTA
ncbi:MAG: nucleoside triphosphate pyrophosphohydrolase [Planctomycetota bacterium]